MRNLAICVLGCCLFAAGAAQAEARSTAINSKDEQAIRKQAKQYQNAFAKGDSQSLSDLWSEEGTYTDASGTEYRNRARIKALFDSYFRTPGAARVLDVQISSIKFPAENVAVEEGTASVNQDGQAISQSSYQCVHIKQKNSWLILSCNESAVPIAPPGINELTWLSGSWLPAGKTSPRLECALGPNKHFLRFGTSVDGKLNQYQIIGIDPRSQKMISWHFDETGGFGQAQWQRAGNSWYESAVGVQADGRATRAAYVIRKINDDKFTWRSTERFLGTTPLPDTDEITFERVPAK